MNKFLLNDHGWQMRNDELKAACGVVPNPKGKGRYLDWPKDLIMMERTIGNIQIMVTPGNLGNDRNHKSSKHRTFAHCPYCGCWVSAGRLHQHLLTTKQCVDQGSRDEYIAEQRRIREGR